MSKIGPFLGSRRQRSRSSASSGSMGAKDENKNTTHGSTPGGSTDDLDLSKRAPGDPTPQNKKLFGKPNGGQEDGARGDSGKSEAENVGSNERRGNPWHGAKLAVWVKGLQDSEELDDLEYQDSEVGSVVGVREGHDEDGENKRMEHPKNDYIYMKDLPTTGTIEAYKEATARELQHQHILQESRNRHIATYRIINTIFPKINSVLYGEVMRLSSELGASNSVLARLAGVHQLSNSKADLEAVGLLVATTLENMAKHIRRDAVGMNAIRDSVTIANLASYAATEQTFTHGAGAKAHFPESELEHRIEDAMSPIEVETMTTIFKGWQIGTRELPWAETLRDLETKKSV